MPDTGFLRTILRDVPADEIGVCYAHEHVLFDASFTTHQFPEFLRNDADRISEELLDFRRAGGRTLVDSMPCGGGRNISMFAEVSRRTGVQIVCPTGIHLSKFYPPGHWSNLLSAERIAEIFIREIEHGIDLNDTNGPDFAASEHRAGLIKVASGLDRIDDRERKVFMAAAIAHQHTRCPILTHTEMGTAAMQQLELFTSYGVPANALVISHTDRRPDLGYHKEILSAGAYLEYDSAFRWKPAEGNPTRYLLEKLCEAGFSTQLLVGMDAAKTSYWRSYGGGPGMTFLLDRFFPALTAEGFPAEFVHRILVENPAHAYARFHK